MSSHKSKLIAIIIAVVVGLHAMLFCMIKSSLSSTAPESSKGTATEKLAEQPSQTQESAEKTVLDDKKSSDSLSQNGAEASSVAPTDAKTSSKASETAPRDLQRSSVETEKYQPFVEDPGDMPKSIVQKMSGCRSGILVDLSSRRILWQKDARSVYAIASMSKIMTAYELMCELKTPGCSSTLETRVQVPRKLFKKFHDCHIYMDPRESFTLEELLKCMMIHSANDCAYLIGEHMGGTEEGFVERMNERAKSLGLNSFSFCNTNGLPDRVRKLANRGCAYDMACLAERVMDIPEIMKWAGTRMDSIREDKRRFDLVNKNHLLNDAKCPGVTGLKTGYIDEAKFCITVTCERDGGRRMVCVVMGADTAKVRDQVVRDLLDWGYSIFKPKNESVK